MLKKHLALTIAGLTSLTLGACGTPAKIDPAEGQYWQRASVSEAAYQQGPKAQQMLNKDIAGCVVELRELERLGSVRNAIPANVHTGEILSSDEKALMTHDSPERDKYLLAEHGNYQDFESCMIWKGWERVKSVPFDVAIESRDNWIKANVNYQYQTRYERNPPKTPTQDDGPYANLNN